MAKEHIDRMVRSVDAFLRPVAVGDGSGVELYLREYETRASLPVGFLPNPVGYARASLPRDTRSPLVQIYDGAWSVPQGGQRNRVWHGDLTVAIEYTSDADLENAEDIMRGYVAALADAFQRNPVVGDGIRIEITDGDRAAAMIDQDSTIRHVRAIGLRAMSHDPR